MKTRQLTELVEDKQVLYGNSEQGKLEKTGCKVICGKLMTDVVKGLMMMSFHITSFQITNSPLHKQGRLNTILCLFSMYSILVIAPESLEVLQANENSLP